MNHPTNNSVRELTENSFNKEVLSQGLALVDFWAEWCGPCRTLGPIVEKIATQNRGTLKVYKVNVDDHPALAQRYEVRGIPTLLLFDNDHLVERIVGVQPAAAIQGIIDSHVAIA
ncbi:MAG: thioredoxin [Gammaproteobacteria bacterium]